MREKEGLGLASRLGLSRTAPPGEGGRDGRELRGFQPQLGRRRLQFVSELWIHIERLLVMFRCP
jgi:hypothetical protein